MPPDYIWPLSKSTTPDEMNTSFGPRINRNKWDFHDGIDLPAPIGTNVMPCGGEYAPRRPWQPKKSQKGIHSRHVVLKVDDPSDERMFLFTSPSQYRRRHYRWRKGDAGTTSRHSRRGRRNIPALAHRVPQGKPCRRRAAFTRWVFALRDYRELHRSGPRPLQSARYAGGATGFRGKQQARRRLAAGGGRPYERRHGARASSCRFQRQKTIHEGNADEKSTRTTLEWRATRNPIW